MSRRDQECVRRLLLVGAVSLSAAAHAASPAEPVRYVVANQPLKGVLADLISNAGLRSDLDISADVTVSRRVFDGTVPALLDRAAADYGLTWVSTGETIYVASTDRVVSRGLRIDPRNRDAARARLLRLGAELRPDLVQFAPDGTGVELRGPERFVAYVAEQLGRIAIPPESDEVRVIRSGKVGGPE